MPSSAIISSIILLGCIILFFIERIPLELTALGGCVALVMFGAADSEAIFSQYASGSVILLICFMIFGRAFAQTGIADRCINALIRLSGGRERILLGISVLACGLISAFMSNVATLAIFYSVFSTLDGRREGFHSRRFMIPLAMASVVGGSCTLIGSAPQLSAQAFLEDIGQPPMGFMTYFPVGGMLLLVLTLYCMLIGYPIGKKIWKESEPVGDNPENNHKIKNEEGRPKWKNVLTLVLFTATIVLMAFKVLPLPVTALLGVLLMVGTGCITPGNLMDAVKWRGVLKLGGILGLMKGFEISGGSQLLGIQMVGLLNTQFSPLILLTILVLITLFLSELMTNSVAMLIVLPIASQICQTVGFSFAPYVIAVVVASQAAVTTPIASTSMMMSAAYGYSFKDYGRHSFLWDLFAAGIICLMVSLLYF